MRRVVLLALLALALPLAAFGTTIDYSNSTGMITSLTTGGAGCSATAPCLSVSSVLTTVSVNNVITQAGTNLGTVSITTGALTSGNLAMGGTLGAGSITITDGATVFTSTFTSAKWALNMTNNGDHSYTLSAKFGPTGMTSQFTVDIGKGFFGSSAVLSSGDTSLTTVPEPSTLGLLGTGLVGIAGLIRRKVKAA